MTSIDTHLTTPQSGKSFSSLLLKFHIEDWFPILNSSSYGITTRFQKKVWSNYKQRPLSFILIRTKYTIMLPLTGTDHHWTIHRKMTPLSTHKQTYPQLRQCESNSPLPLPFNIFKFIWLLNKGTHVHNHWLFSFTLCLFLFHTHNCVYE